MGGSERFCGWVLKVLWVGLKGFVGGSERFCGCVMCVGTIQQRDDTEVKCTSTASATPPCISDAMLLSMTCDAMLLSTSCGQKRSICQSVVRMQHMK